MIVQSEVRIIAYNEDGSKAEPSVYAYNRAAYYRVYWKGFKVIDGNDITNGKYRQFDNFLDAEDMKSIIETSFAEGVHGLGAFLRKAIGV